MIKKLRLLLVPKPRLRIHLKKAKRRGGGEGWRYNLVSADDGRVAAISTRTDYATVEEVVRDIQGDFPGVLAEIVAKED